MSVAREPEESKADDFNPSDVGGDVGHLPIIYIIPKRDRSSIPSTR
jgi:hypothetical protein